MADALSQLLDDIEAEREETLRVLRGLKADDWDRPSPAEGWLLRDCVVHLAETDEHAAEAVERRKEPPREDPPRQPRNDGPRDVLTPNMRRAREWPPAEVLDWWRRAGNRMIAALREVTAEERLPWAGRSLSALSFTSARLMEHWSHGLDIHDAAGVAPVDTDRLKNIAHLGYLTRDFAYRTHGLQPPATPLYVELVSPSGETWSWGPADAPDRIYGSAGDFCRVVTQRIHPLDTDLRAEGAEAERFLKVAQAFAGPPGSGRPAKKSRAVN